MKAKMVFKYVVLLVVAIVLALIYCFIIHSGLDFSPITSGGTDIKTFVISTFSITTTITFVCMFFYMVFFIKFLIRLFK